MHFYFDLRGLLSLAKVLQLICVAASCVFGLLHASNDLPATKWSYNLGVDIWRLDPSVERDPAPWNAQNTNLLLANAVTKWDYKNTSPYITLAANKSLLNSTFLSLKAQANQTSGLRVDEAALQHHISPSLGVRAGVVNYKTSWCRTYEPDNGWIREAETICLTKSFNDVTGGAPGAQLFSSTTWGNYLIQNQIGIYRPLAFNYAPKEFGNYYPSPNYEVVRNKKIGVNINVVNLENALEGRLSYMRASQQAYLPEPEIRSDVPQTSNMWYWGLSAPITHKLNVRLTQLRQNQDLEFWPITDGEYRRVLDVAQRKKATTLELAYRFSSVDLLSVGISQTKFDTNKSFYSPQGIVVYREPPFYIQTKQFSAAWRHDWSNRMFGIVQIVLAQQRNGVDGFDFSSHGNAIGFRVGYQH